MDSRGGESLLLSFSFVATGSMDLAASNVYRKLASLLAEKWNINYSHCLFWVDVSFKYLAVKVRCDVFLGSLII